MVDIKASSSLLAILIYFIVCPVLWGAHGKRQGSHYEAHGRHEQIRKSEAPCADCPRHGRCVPMVQCAAHLRSATRLSCHLHTTLGVCCFTRGHAAEFDLKSRTATSISEEDAKSAHKQSRAKLDQWLSRADNLLAHSRSTVVNVSSPSYAHHLSMITYDKNAISLGRGALMNMFAAQDLKSRQAVSDDELVLSLTGHTNAPFCPPQPSCSPSMYRTMGGGCNNPSSSSWGAVHTAFERLLPPSYADGIWSLRTSSSGQPLPSARAVSTTLLLDSSHPSPLLNLLFMQFGQFIAHDMSAGVVFTIGNGSAISCCTEDGQLLSQELQHWACAPILLDPKDPFYGHFGHKCINFVRAQMAPASDCTVGYAKQMNGASHYPDLSHLYGTSSEKLASLVAPGGLLKTFLDYGRELPPLTERAECLAMKNGAACFESGDNHGNQIISLTVLHSIWTREHNRVAKALSRLNPAWDESKIFMEARRILQAEFQHIIFNEWLPFVLGPELMQVFELAPSAGYSSSYDPHVNPSLSAEFSAAAMRFGHSIVDGKLVVPNPNNNGVFETISIPEVMFQPSRLRLRPFLDRLLLGLVEQPMQTVDPLVTEALTRYMFHGGNPYGLDLASINIQRGRDHGIRPYNDYRRLIGLQPFTSFQQFTPSAAQRLASVYESPEDIDLWIGGLLEEPVQGGIVGPTFANIIADQFNRLKKGDRYFYENAPDVSPGAFTPSQLAEIRKVTLSRIICDNKDGIELTALPPEAFVRADILGNEPVPCDSTIIPFMDLNRFKEL